MPYTSPMTKRRPSLLDRLTGQPRSMKVASSEQIVMHSGGALFKSPVPVDAARPSDDVADRPTDARTVIAPNTSK